MNDDQITAFLSTLAAMMDQYEVEPSTETCSDILSESPLCQPHDVRCPCGIDVSKEENEMIICMRCGYSLHRSCLDLPVNFSDKDYICPICAFQNDGSDPLYQLSYIAERFNSIIPQISRVLKKADDLSQELPDRLQKLEMYNHYDDCFDLLEHNLKDIKSQFESQLEDLNKIDSPLLPPSPSAFQ